MYYTHPLRHLEEDESGTVGLIDSKGRTQATLVISESGLYRLIFKSRKKEAQDFIDWVVEDVLPTIRQTGSYSIPQPANPAIQFLPLRFV